MLLFRVFVELDIAILVLGSGTAAIRAVRETHRAVRKAQNLNRTTFLYFPIVTQHTTPKSTTHFAYKKTVLGPGAHPEADE